MKIVYIATSIIPSRTANSIHVMKMCQAFAQNGHDVTLIVPDWKEGVEPGVEDVYEFYGVKKCFEIIWAYLPSIKGGGVMFAWLASARAVNKLMPDILYTRDIATSFFSVLRDQPVIFEAHAPVSDKPLDKFFFHALLQRSAFKNIVVISHRLRDIYIKRYPSLVGRIQVAPDGADPVTQSLIPINVSNNGLKLQVGYVGHLYPGRGLDIIEGLAKRCCWIGFHIIGGTEQDIASCKKRMESRDNIFFYGFQTPKNTERYRLGCDVLLAPYQSTVSVSGGRGNSVEWMSPLKIFEYMAAGKAIVCSDLPVLREILEDGKNAILCSPEEIGEWEKALNMLYLDMELRSTLGDNAQHDFLTHYSWSKRAEIILMSIAI